MFDRMVGKKVVMMREVLRSGKQQDKTVSLNLKLMDADGRPSEVTRTPCLLGNWRWPKTHINETLSACCWEERWNFLSSSGFS